MRSGRRRLLRLLAAACALWPLVAGAGNEGERPMLHLGVISERVDQPDYMLAQYAPLLDYLRRQLDPQGFAVGELCIAADIPELVRFIRAGKVDIVFESLITTFRINAAGASLQPSLAAWRKERRETRTVFFVRQASPIKRLRDLAGKTLVLASSRSTTAYALPKIVLRRQGLDVQPLGALRGGLDRVRYVLSAAEANQAYWVDRGRADAGAFNTEDWEELPSGLRQRLSIIYTSEPILHWLLSARTGLPSAALEAVQKALLNMPASSDGLQALQRAGRIRRFDRLDGGDLASIRNWRAATARSGFGE